MDLNFGIPDRGDLLDVIGLIPEELLGEVEFGVAFVLGFGI